jgi:hypothetical protein
VWRRRRFAWEEEEVRECSVLLHNVVLQTHVHDRWKWLLDPIEGYSVRGAYQFLTFADAPLDRELIDNVWHNHIPLKVSLFTWRLLRKRLPTKDNMVRRGVIQESTTCVRLAVVPMRQPHIFFRLCHFG